MQLSTQIRITRQKAFLSQEKFAKEIGVSTSTVIRWENGKGRPNLKALSKIKEFCDKHSLSYDEISSEWLSLTEGE